MIEANEEDLYGLYLGVVCVQNSSTNHHRLICLVALSLGLLLYGHGHWPPAAIRHIVFLSVVRGSHAL